MARDQRGEARAGAAAGGHGKRRAAGGGGAAPGGEAFGTREAVGGREPHLPIPAGAQGGKGKTEINQHIDTKVELTLNGTGSTEKDAKRIGDATGAGPATAVQLANDRARTAGKLP